MKLVIKKAIEDVLSENELEFITINEMGDDDLSQFLFIMDHFEIEFDEAHSLNEAEHRGRKVKLNKPFRTPGGPKKFAVYVKSKGGNIKKVTFGDPNMRVRNRSKARAKSFTARHKCSQKKDRTTAGYWSCNVSRYRKALGLSSSRTW